MPSKRLCLAWIVFWICSCEYLHFLCFLSLLPCHRSSLYRPLPFHAWLQWRLRVAARSIRLQQRKMLCFRQRASLLVCLTVIVFEKQIDTYTVFSRSIPVLLYFKMVLHSNLGSLSCKRASCSWKWCFLPKVESSYFYSVSNKTGHVSPARKLSQLSWNFIVNGIVFKNSTDFQFSFLGSVIGALFNGIFIIWHTKARTPIIPHVRTPSQVQYGKHSS